MTKLNQLTQDVINKHRERLDLLGHGAVVFSKTHKFGMGSWDGKYFLKHGAKELTVSELTTELYETEQEQANRLDELLKAL